MLEPETTKRNLLSTVFGHAFEHNVKVILLDLMQDSPVSPHSLRMDE